MDVGRGALVPGACLSGLLAAGCADAIGLSELAYDRDPPIAAGGAGSGGLGGGGAGGEGGELPCPGFEFGDDFEGTMVADDWEQSATQASIGVEGGELVLASDSDANSMAGIETLQPHDAPSGTFSVELVQGVGDDPTATVVFSLLGSTGTLRVKQFATTLRLSYQVSITENTLWEGSYDPVAHRYVRLKATETQRILESSTDGMTWSEIHAEDEGNIFEFVGVKASLGYNGNSTPLEVRFDNFLVCAQ